MSEPTERRQLESLAAASGRMADVLDTGTGDSVIGALADLTGEMAATPPAILNAAASPSGN